MSEETMTDTIKSEPNPGSAETKVPRVFISYSHDTVAHKQWVAELGSELMKKGVDVILDQWEIGPGDDVPKFMEKAISSADCVLMICSEAYVLKADDGKGGVGYEAMIVTGELVKNLGSSKFVPIVRQANGSSLRPKSVSTRYYVNLSEGSNREEALKDLVHKLHKVPKNIKPVLGDSPFASLPAAASQPGSDAERAGTNANVADAVGTHAAGLEIACKGDMVAWRQLVRKVKAPLSQALMEWRQRYDGQGAFLMTALPDLVTEAAAIYSPLISLALAGVESTNEKFANQKALLDDFLLPKNWNLSGSTILTRIPEALAFTYQALHGATCLETRQLGLAIALSRTRVTCAHESKGELVHRDHQLIGWPESFDTRCDTAWRYLVSLPKKCPWLLQIFGSNEDYEAALCGYYLSLNVQELGDMLARGEGAALDSEEGLHFTIPLSCHVVTREVLQRGYRLLTDSPDDVRAIWRSLGVTDSAMAAAWPKWIKQCHKWISKLSRFGYRGGVAHAELLQDIPPESGK
jgi:hypothetical protein